MRIDGPNNMEIQGPTNASNKLTQPASTAGARSGAVDKLSDLDDANRPYIRKAAEGDEINLEAIAEATKLIEAGELDTPEAIARTAEIILSTGI